MVVRLVAGVVAATCGVALLASCSGGSQTTSAGQNASSSPSGKSSTMSASGGSSTSPAGGSSSASAAPKITIENFKFQVPATVKPGQKITVVNSDSVGHTVTSDTSGDFSVVVNANGGTATFTAPTKPGKYPFHCNFHGNMHGTLVVS